MSLAAGATSFAVPSARTNVRAPNYMILKTFNLCLASTVISITSVLNFSLAAGLALAMGLPLSFSSASSSTSEKAAKFAVYTVLSLGWLLFSPTEVALALRNWEVLGVWFAPFVCVVYTPLVLQAGIVCLLSS